MKSVLISIQPKYCELIASGKKTVEVRKTKPKLQTPFKCYIYETQGRTETPFVDEEGHHIFKGRGQVIGEFVCDKIIRINYSCGSYRCEGFNRLENDRIASGSQLSLYDMRNYLSCNGGYAWHITDLVIYDKPKELSEFCQKCKSYDKDEWENDDCLECENPCGNGGKLYLKRPPQSWCYVEELKGGAE